MFDFKVFRTTTIHPGMGSLPVIKYSNIFKYFVANLMIIHRGMQIRLFLQRSKEALHRAVVPSYHQDLKRLVQVPGIGRVSAWTILAEIGDISRFPSDKQFVSYCRLVPGSQDSGGKQRHKSGCKDGNKYLKMAFTQAAIAGYCNHKPIRKYYHKLKRRRTAPVARNVVAKQLARIVWHMLANNESYKGFKGEPTKPTHISYWPHSVSPARPQGD